MRETTSKVEMNKPKVSIVTISYNQEQYIQQTLDSFIDQKTDFNFEVIIADDCSTDNTAGIIREYAEKFPNIIKPILRKKNIGIQSNFIDALQHASGTYIALCEGDDFWTDSLKLHKQVNFLETHKDYSLVFHPVRVFFENHEEEDVTFPTIADSKQFTLKNLLKNNYIQTNSVMYRKVNYDNLLHNVMPFDWYLHLTHAREGKIGFINEVMAAYRRHADGVWWETTHQARDEIWKRHGAAHMLLYAELLKVYGDKVENRQIIDEHIEGTVNILNRIDDAEKISLIGDFVKTHPDLNAILMLSLSRITYKNYKQMDKDQEALRQLKEELYKANREIEKLKREKENILNSKAYIVGDRLAQISRIIRRIK